jgi:hypothetical protein
MTRKRSFHTATACDLSTMPRDEFNEIMKEGIRWFVEIGALVDSGHRDEDGSIRWVPDMSHPIWAQVGRLVS